MLPALVCWWEARGGLILLYSRIVIGGRERLLYKRGMRFVTDILRIPGSGTLVAVDVMLTGNSVGGTLWTDTLFIAPMLHSSPRLQKHGQSGEFFWKEDCEVVGTSISAACSEFEVSPVPAVDLTEQDLASLLPQLEELDESRQRYVRTLLWWRANDTVRYEKPKIPFQEFSELHQRNLNDLRSMPVEDDESRIVAAEASRELGMFEDAADLLRGPFKKPYPILQVIQSAVDEGEQRLLRVFQGFY